MYRPSFYNCQQPERAYRLIEAHPFAVLVSSGGSLMATHVPLLLTKNTSGEAELFGHLARANPQCEALFSGAEVLCVFSGHDGYISPRWYGDEEDVPTWNYSAVHVYGLCQQIKQHAQVRELLDATCDHFEKDFDEPWNTQMISQDIVEGFQGGVIAFSISITRIEAATKLGQDKSAADRQRVSDGLDQTAVAAGPCPLANDMRDVLLKQA